MFSRHGHTDELYELGRWRGSSENSFRTRIERTKQEEAARRLNTSLMLSVVELDFDS